MESEVQSVDLSFPISELTLGVRVRKAFRRLGIQTLGDLIRRDSDDLLECKNFGMVSLNEVSCLLEGFGLSLKPGKGLLEK